MFTLWLKVQYSLKKFNVYRIADSDADKKIIKINFHANIITPYIF